MAEYKICPKCNHKNKPMSFMCNNCGESLFEVTSIDVDEDSLNSIENEQASDSAQVAPKKESSDAPSVNKVEYVDYSNLFSSNSSNSNNKSEPAKQVNFRIKDQDSSSASVFRYCTCGECNAPTASKCSSCGADISTLNTETREEHLRRINEIRNISSGLKINANSSSRNNRTGNSNFKENKPTRVSSRIESTDGKFSLEITECKMVVGRGLESDGGIKAYLSDKGTVSRKHLEIWKNQKGIVVKDVGSKNGSFINGNRLLPQKEYILHVGDKLALSSNNEVEFDIK